MRAILAWFLFVSVASAADPLSCRVPTREVPLRKGGTIILDATLTNRTNTLLEGRLEAIVLHGTRKGSTHAGPELVIPPGSLATQLLLPPPLDPGYGEGFAVRLTFVGKTQSFALGDHPLGRFPDGGEGFVLAIARTSRRVSEVDRLRERSVRLETLRPALETSAWFATASLSVEVANLPSQATGWCAYDVVSLDAQAFSEMTRRQLEALARWIEAGGSAVIFADGAVGEPQLEFLRRAAGPHAVISTDAEQKLTDRFNQMLQVELGRVLLAPSAPTTQRILDLPAWRAAIAWLWKVHPRLVDHIEEHGAWPVRRIAQDSDASDVALGNWVRRVATDVRREGLDRPRALPIGWVALLLGSLLFLTGPADWLILGWLRRRRWTWAVFPSICIAFAWMASHLAARYLGPGLRSTSVRVTDLGQGDRVLREVLMHFRMPPRDEEWITEMADGVCVAMPPLTKSEESHAVPGGEVPDTRTEWLTPSRFVLRQNLRQWTLNWQQAVSFHSSKPATPNWGVLIDRWVRNSRTPEQKLAEPESGFTIYYAPKKRDRADPPPYQILPAESPIDLTTAAQLCSEGSPLPDVLELQSPVLVASEMLAARPRGPLAILAWRQDPDGLQVLRRHISARELPPDL